MLVFITNAHVTILHFPVAGIFCGSPQKDFVRISYQRWGFSRFHFQSSYFSAVHYDLPNVIQELKQGPEAQNYLKSFLTL